MIAKIYFALWLGIGVLAGLLYVTGNFGLTTAVVFGFIVFTMVFMGMMSVLPATIAHPAPAGIAKAESSRDRRSLREYIHDLLGAWNSPDIQMRNPKFH